MINVDNEVIDYVIINNEKVPVFIENGELAVKTTVPLIHLIRKPIFTVIIPNESGIMKRHHRSILNEKEVAALRMAHELGYGYKRLAKMFDISVACAQKIANYQRR